MNVGENMRQNEEIIKTIPARPIESMPGLIDAYLTAWNAGMTLSEAVNAGLVGSVAKFDTFYRHLIMIEASKLLQRENEMSKEGL
jgi:hypothetical protein